MDALTPLLIQFWLLVAVVVSVAGMFGAIVLLDVAAHVLKVGRYGR